MLVAADVDGSVDSDPATFGSLLAALRAAGHHVAILTGSSTAHPTAQDCADKVAYLKALGCGACWDTLVVFPNPPAVAKAQWCRANGVALLLDNDLANAKAAAPYTTVLVPFNSADPPKGLKRKFRPEGPP